MRSPKILEKVWEKFGNFVLDFEFEPCIITKLKTNKMITGSEDQSGCITCALRAGFS